MKILAAMSGGADSSVAAAMLVRDGHDVTGGHLRLTEQTPAMDGRVHGCCGVADADDARRVAQVLDIPFYVWNLKDAFAHGVVDDFVGEYARGRTPNPCVRCNETVKFGALRERARALGFDALATGHYARATHEADGWHLYRGGDQKKDQSYVLARLGQEELARARFPVGAQSKDETRALAHELGLRTADKPDSYEICFVPDGNAGAFVERELGPLPAGEIVGTDGAVLGEHGGPGGMQPGGFGNQGGPGGMQPGGFGAQGMPPGMGAGGQGAGKRRSGSKRFRCVRTVECIRRGSSMLTATAPACFSPSRSGASHRGSLSPSTWATRCSAAARSRARRAECVGDDLYNRAVSIRRLRGPGPSARS